MDHQVNHQSPQSNNQKLALKFEKMEMLLSRNSGFEAVGEILEALLYNSSQIAGKPDPRGSFQAKAVSRFLQGRNKVEMLRYHFTHIQAQMQCLHQLHRFIVSAMPHSHVQSLLG